MAFPEEDIEAFGGPGRAKHWRNAVAKADRWCLALETWGIAVSAVCLLIVGVLGSVDILTTTILSKPIPMTVEISSYMMALIVFGTFAYAQQRHEHVAIDVLVNLLPAPLRYVCQLLSLIAGLLVFSVLAWRSWALFVDSYAISETATASIPFVVWPFKLGAFLFLVLGTLEFARQVAWSLCGSEWKPRRTTVEGEIA